MRLEQPALAPVLVSAAARSDDPRSKALGARGLGALKETSAFDLLASLTRDPNELVAFEALRALGALGDERGREEAARLLRSPSDLLRRQALLTIAALPAESRLRARIVPFIGDPSPWIRAAALAALARTDRDNFALVLSGLDPDPVWWVRAALARSLGELGDEMSVGILHAMLQDEDAAALPAVLTALRQARGNDSVDTLVRHLQHPSLGVRVAAAENLKELGAKGLSGPLLEAWRLGLGEGELEGRLAVVATLAAQADEAALAALGEIAADDPSRAVRARAAEALRALGAPEVPDPGPRRRRSARPRLPRRDGPPLPAPRGVAVHAPGVPDHAVRRHRDPPGRGRGPSHQPLLRSPRPARLLRRAHLPPHRARLRHPGRGPLAATATVAPASPCAAR